MKEESVMRQLIQELAMRQADEDLIEAVLTILETEDNFLKMIEEVLKLEHPSKACLLGKAILIAEKA